MGHQWKLVFKFMNPRKKGVLIRVCLISLILWCLVYGWWLSNATSQAFLPTIAVQHLDHFRINRNLKSYLEEIEVLIEPSSVACQDVPLLVLVTSSPTHFEQRHAIRKTWGPYYPTYFILGLNVPSVENLDTDNYLEAKQYSDIIIYDFQDHYQNLTLKTGLILKWTLGRCSPRMLFKVDDDILVNPWMMRRVLEENNGRDLVGYRVSGSAVHRDVHSKWFLPRWLYTRDAVPEYLSGTGYLISGKHIKAILTAAYKVPMINLEDIYFTYLVSRQKLDLTLSHDYRLSPYKPWATVTCAYWGLASMHSFQPTEMINKWENINYLLNKSTSNNSSVCNYFLNNVWSEWLLF